MTTGKISSIAKGEMVTVSYNVNLIGDILIFVEPNNISNSVKTGQIENMSKLILTDKTIIKQNALAITLLWQKLFGLTLVPKILTGFISLSLTFYAYFKAVDIYEALNFNIDYTLIKIIFPVLLFSLVIIIHRYIRFRLITLIVFFIRQLHQIKRKISS